MSIERWSDDILLVKLASEPAFTETMAALRAQLDARSYHVVLDMSGVALLNSSNLAQLLRTRKQLLGAEMKMYLAAVSDSVWSVIAVTGLDRVFDFSPDAASALATIQMAKQDRS